MAVLPGYRKAPKYVFASVLSVIFLLPFYIMLRNALMTRQQVGSPDWSWLPDPLSWVNFGDLFADTSVPMAHSLGNSFLVAIVTAPVGTLFGSMAGYALARINVPGRRFVFTYVLVTLMIPQSVTFVPTFVVVGSMGGVNTEWGIIAPNLFSAFTVILFRNFYLRFPVELEEAGRLDGLGYLGVYRRLVLPNSGSMIASLGALMFIESWNAFLWPLVIGQDPSSWTAQIALSTFLTAQSVNLPALFAGALVTIAPLVAMFLVAQRFIVRGIAASGLKE
ncbi:sugar ABC transporter permease [Amycolatopsis mediterranei S699]|uniref:Permease component of ABC-type sugar transport system n=2 Tax=Amycolatopsis mediterranei TaxID=33910 RepID=A0A0H3D003_AMYMU|nr:carbohydrate ABC transporter permease [Amycolatopsis mediterranei]ADJ43665.1 permease component of ABC-type sugar transport system [Amycolatopsis mediterranei U32]AEK40373.1 sugar ABC transporter permease [Amycolatopsis mediterranei S699]AFO75377.1 sugar ABC transporter permease [Amycolatopsis mediterranei S699]AGT82506.1 sugar ABC transporter permease [Amycolatopsis mediterranei RB]KDO10243.1 sugar ABC transporter permease [Amycolatopsis mediterranei]